MCFGTHRKEFAGAYAVLELADVGCYLLHVDISGYLGIQQHFGPYHLTRFYVEDSENNRIVGRFGVETSGELDCRGIECHSSFIVYFHGVA